VQLASDIIVKAAVEEAQAVVDLSPSHIPSVKRLCSSHEDELARSEVAHVVGPAPAQAVDEVWKRDLDLSPSHIPSCTILEEPRATDLLLSEGMQIEVPLQDSQGQSAEVVPAPPRPCFELLQSR